MFCHELVSILRIRKNYLFDQHSIIRMNISFLFESSLSAPVFNLWKGLQNSTVAQGSCDETFRIQTNRLLKMPKAILHFF